MTSHPFLQSPEDSPDRTVVTRNFYDYTRGVVRELLDHADEMPPMRAYSGRYRAKTDEAMLKTRRKWQEFAGHELPDTIDRSSYALTPAEGLAFDGLHSSVEGPLTAEPTSHRKVINREELRARLATMRRDSYAEVLGYDAAEPDLSLRTTLEPAPWVRAGGQLCVLGVYGMNVERLVDPNVVVGHEVEEEHWFDPTIALHSVNKHPNAPALAAFDLPWLLRTLTTDHAAAITGRTTRVITTVGADMGEIEEHIIDPLQQRASDLEFTLSAVLASTFSTSANHAVSVLEATDEAIRVADPKEGVVTVTGQEFWDRWAATNLQASVTISRPVSKNMTTR